MDRSHSVKRAPARIIGGVRTALQIKKTKPQLTQAKITKYIKSKDENKPQIHKQIDLNKIKFKQLNGKGK